MKCLICADEINNSRMGVNACRACAAFYKRAEGQFDKLLCKDRKNKCHERNPKTTCRRCRMARFKEVLEQAEDKSPLSSDLHSVEMEVGTDSSPDSAAIGTPEAPAFTDHRFLYQREPSNSKTPLLDRIKKGYSLMCAIRRSGELALHFHGEAGTSVEKNGVVLYPTSYSSMLSTWKLMRQAMFEFANVAFEEFECLDYECKDTLVERSLLFLELMESTHRARRHFPDDTELRMVGYTTYLHISDLEKLFDNCPDDIDKPNLISEFKRALIEFSRIVRQQFEIAQPSDVEFLALFGLSFWSEEFVGHDDPLNKIANVIRSEILRELNIHYKSSGIIDYAARVGQIFCLLINSMTGAAKVHEDYQVFKLLNIFGGEVFGSEN